MVLHEMRNPLHDILLAIDAIRSNENHLGTLGWILTGMERSAAKIDALTDDLMNLCQASHSTFKLHSRPVDLTVAALATIERQRNHFKKKELSITFHATSEPVVIAADPDRLDLLLDNLLSNAAKYCSTGGKIIVSVSIENEEAVLQIEDTGIGISPEILPFVFNPFVRERKSAEIGSGIGLLIVRTLVESHGGTVEANSPGRGKGSTFILRFPSLKDKARPMESHGRCHSFIESFQ